MKAKSSINKRSTSSNNFYRTESKIGKFIKVKVKPDFESRYNSIGFRESQILKSGI